MTVQSLELARKLTQTKIKEAKREGYKTLSLGIVFKGIRENENLSFFGDYPLLAVIVEEIKKVFEISRWSLSSVMRKSEELSQLSKKEKSELVNQLLDACTATES